MKLTYLLLLCLLLGTPAWSAQPLIVSGHPNYPPYMWIENGLLIGIGVELTKTICHELALDCELAAISSWKRVQEKVRSGEIDLIVGSYTNIDRQEYMAFSDAYLQDKISIFVRKNHHFPFTGIEDLSGKRGVAIYGESFGQELDLLIADRLQLTRAYTAKALFENLRLGRVDYIIWGDYPWYFNAHILGASDWCGPLAEPIAKEGMALAFSQKSQFRDRLPEVNKIIERLQQDGTIVRWKNHFMSHYIATIAEGAR